MFLPKLKSHRVLENILTCLSVATLVLHSCSSSPVSTPTSDYDLEVAVRWFDLYLYLAQTTRGFTPPVASRAFAYAGVTLYEAVVPGMPSFQSLAGQLNGLPPLPKPVKDRVYHWPSVANAALASITRKLFVNTKPDNKHAINSLEEQLATIYEAQLDDKVFERSVIQGYAVAEVIFNWSLSDGGNEAELRNYPIDYTPPPTDGNWLPTPPQFYRALLPSWGSNRPFILETGKECAPPPPPTYSEEINSEFYMQAEEVYTIVNNLSLEQMDVVRFWADDAGQTATPAGHSISILSQVLRQKRASLDLAAEAYAKVGIAVADAFIGAWDSKYSYNLLRPISYIQEVIDARWQTPIYAPPFPEYPSGHSVQSAAAAQVMTDIFGKEITITDHTHAMHVLASRSYNSFFEFAEEAAISRFYGGIHYRMSIERGLEQGICIGQKVSAILFKK